MNGKRGKVLGKKPLDDAAATADGRDALEHGAGRARTGTAHQRDQRVEVRARLGPAHQQRAAEPRHQPALERLAVVVPLVPRQQPSPQRRVTQQRWVRHSLRNTFNDNNHHKKRLVKLF